MFDDHLVERLVVAIGDERFGGGIIEAASFLDQTLEGAAAVVEVSQVVFWFGGAERMHVKADIFAAATVTVAFEDADLIVIMTEHESEMTGIFLGARAKQIVNHSRIPVLSIKPHVGKFEALDLGGSYTF